VKTHFLWRVSKSCVLFTKLGMGMVIITWETGMRLTYILIWSAWRNDDRNTNFSNNMLCIILRNELKVVLYKMSIDSSEDKLIRGCFKTSLKNLKEYIVARIAWRLYKTGIGITTGFIESHTITHNYSVYALQLTTVHYNTCRVFTLCLHSLPVFQYRRIRSPATLQLFSEDCCSARILTRNWNCPRHC
jgi:S-adenosylmethionine/arginine decarboxylase-like enzyme